MRNMEGNSSSHVLFTKSGVYDVMKVVCNNLQLTKSVPGSFFFLASLYELYAFFHVELNCPERPNLLHWNKIKMSDKTKVMKNCEIAVSESIKTSNCPNCQLKPKHISPWLLPLLPFLVAYDFLSLISLHFPLQCVRIPCLEPVRCSTAS